MESPAPRSAHERFAAWVGLSDARPGRSGLLILASCAGLFAIVVINLAFSLWADRVERLDNARESANNLARIVERHANGTLAAVDLTLRDLVRSLAPGATIDTSEKMHLRLKNDLAALPGLRALYVVDVTGRRIISSTVFPTPPIDLSDRDYFTTHRDHISEGVFVDKPLVSRVGGNWLIPFSRRIDDERGRFKGVAVAALETPGLQEFLDVVNVGSGGSVALLHKNGVMLGRSPDLKGVVGQDYSRAEVFTTHLPRSPVGSYSATSVVDGTKRVYAYRSVGNWPLVIVAGRDESVILAGWYARVRQQSLAALILVAGIAALGTLLWRESKRRDRLTAALSTSEARFRDLTNLSADWYWEQDAELRFTEFSPHADKRAGLHVAELLGRRRPDIDAGNISEGDRLRLDEATAAHAEFRDITFARAGDDGRLNWVQISGTPISDAGRFSGYRGVGKDVTALVNAQLALAAREQHYRMLFDANPHPMWVYDYRTLDILDSNRAATRQYGYSRKEFLALKVPALLPPEDHAPVRKAYDDGIFIGHRRSQWRHVKKSGEIIDVETISDDIEFEGLPARLVVAMDITDRVRAEEAVRRMNLDLEERVRLRTAELESANHELEAFSDSVSHDLRAPLRHVAGFASALSDNATDLGPERQHQLGRILGAVARMGELIDALLAFSRTSRAEIQMGVVDLDRLIAEVRDECMQDANGRFVQWNIRPLPKIMGDARLLRPAFHNLLSNAIKFTGKRSQARIDIGPLEGGEEAANETTIYVRDNGAGFDPARADNLFRVFRRLHAEQDFPGTGIGLATVSRIVARHGGRITAEGAVEQGATFRITLRRASVAAAA